MAKTKTVAKVSRTSEGLRDALFDEIDGLREGTSTPNKASAVAKLAVNIINSAFIEVEYQKLVNGPTSQIFPTVKPIRLGKQ